MDIKYFAKFLMTDQCYQKYFVEFDFLDVPCFKAVLSKLLGYGIVLGAVMVKMPQIYKVVKAKSAAGLNFIALLLEIFAVTSMFTYSLAKEFPFSSWGDALFLLIQNAILGYLIQHYNGNKTGGAVFLIILAAIVFILVSKFTPMSLLTALQASNLPAVVVSKLMQAYNNFKNGSTGQLSAITAFLLFAGSLSRIFTSIQETGDNLIIVNYVLSTACNGIIAFQILWYWNVSTVKSKKE